MSLLFGIEVEEGVSLEALFNLGVIAGGVIDDDWISFPSGLKINVVDNEDNANIQADESTDIWHVGARCHAFMRPASYDRCWYDLARFAELISVNCSERFVMSFEYDRIYLVRDEDGLRTIRNGVVDSKG